MTFLPYEIFFLIIVFPDELFSDNFSRVNIFFFDNIFPGEIILTIVFPTNFFFEEFLKICFQKVELPAYSQ